jgi:hypothetical protein
MKAGGAILFLNHLSLPLRLRESLQFLALFRRICARHSHPNNLTSSPRGPAEAELAAVEDQRPPTEVRANPIILGQSYPVFEI